MAPMAHVGTHVIDGATFRPRGVTQVDSVLGVNADNPIPARAAASNVQPQDRWFIIVDRTFHVEAP